MLHWYCKVTHILVQIFSQKGLIFWYGWSMQIGKYTSHSHFNWFKELGSRHIKRHVEE
jgi:hypothetical protein